MHGNAVSVGKLLRLLSRRQRSDLARSLRERSGMYERRWLGSFRVRSSVSSDSSELRRIEELMVPTVLAGRVPVEEPRFHAAMCDLGQSIEDILVGIASGTGADAEAEIAPSMALYLVATVAMMTTVVLWGIVLFR